MKSRRARLSAEIETGSFSDISFLLIIFFVLASHFMKTAYIPALEALGATGVKVVLEGERE